MTASAVLSALVKPAPDPCAVTLGRTAHGLGGSGVDRLSEVVVQPVKREPRDGPSYALNNRRRERNSIWIAAQKGDRGPIGIGMDRVRDEQDPLAAGTRRPVRHRASGEVTTDLVQRTGRAPVRRGGRRDQPRRAARAWPIAGRPRAPIGARRRRSRRRRPPPGAPRRRSDRPTSESTYQHVTSSSKYADLACWQRVLRRV